MWITLIEFPADEKAPICFKKQISSWGIFQWNLNLRVCVMLVLTRPPIISRQKVTKFVENIPLNLLKTRSCFHGIFLYFGKKLRKKIISSFKKGLSRSFWAPLNVVLQKTVCRKMNFLFIPHENQIVLKNIKLPRTKVRCRVWILSNFIDSP